MTLDEVMPAFLARETTGTMNRKTTGYSSDSSLRDTVLYYDDTAVMRLADDGLRVYCTAFSVRHLNDIFAYLKLPLQVDSHDERGAFTLSTPFGKKWCSTLDNVAIADLLSGDYDE